MPTKFREHSRYTPPNNWPVSLSDRQLRAVMLAAEGLPPDKRALLLERIAAVLRLRGRHSDADVDIAVNMALRGLHHEPAA